MRTIEVIFWGLALFVPQENGYRVLLPDGTKAPEFGLPAHTAMIDIRPKTAKPTSHKWDDWPHDEPEATENTFTIQRYCEIKFAGLIGEPLAEQYAFSHRLPNTRKSDKYFKPKTLPEVIAAVPITLGELTSHQKEKGKMVATKWTVHAEDDSVVTLSCGNERSITLAPETKQVVLVNFAASALHENHFRLYRLISGYKKKKLDPKEPQKKPLGEVEIEGGKPGGNIQIETPFIDCSNASMVPPEP